MPEQQRDVLGALAQRRHLDRQVVEPLEQVEPEPSVGHHLLEVLVGGGHESHVRRLFARVAHRAEHPLLEHAQQLGLDVERQIPDLVEEQSAALGRLHLADAIRDRRSERTTPVSEQLGVGEPLFERRARNGHERPVRARSAAVKNPREQALAGSALAAQQHGMLRLRRLADPLLQRAHRR